MQKFELQINNILNVHEQYDSILSLNSVLTVLSEYYLATAILSMAIFFSISPKIQSKSFKQTKFSLFSSISFQFNYLAILIIFFYCFLSVKQNFLFLSDFVSFNNSLHNDFISLLAKLIIGISSLIYLIFVQQFLTDQKLNYFEYYILILTSILGLCLLCCSDDLLTAYLAIELQSLSFYVLASFKRNSNYSVESGVKYFILGSFSTIIFLFGSNLIYGLSGSISIVDFKDLFIWVFSANSFFLSFESISKALESFQDKTFKLDDDIKDLQTIYDKFLILKNNTSLNSSDLNNLLLELNGNKTLSPEETIDNNKLNLYQNISQKMIEIANQIDNSSYYYYKNHLDNEKEISSSLQFTKDLLIDSLTQNSAVWFMSDMQNLGNEYEDTLDFKQDLYSINSYSDLLDKFKYNWFFIENPINYSDDLEYMSSILTKNQTVRDIDEFFYFNHLSHSLDMSQEISNPINSINNLDFSEKFILISKKLKLLGYISCEDANLILSEIQILLDTKMLSDNKLLETNLFSENEINLYKTFSEILVENFKKNSSDLEDFKKLDSFAEISNNCSKILLFLDSFYSPVENSINSQCFKDNSVLNNYTDLSSCLSKSLVIDTNKIIFDYLNTIVSFIVYSVNNQDIYMDSDIKNLVINEDLKLNSDKEKLAHLKIIAKKFELFGQKTTLSLQEAKSIFLGSKDLLTSNYYTSEKANLYEVIANSMKSNYNQDSSIFTDRIERLKNSNEFSYLISTFKSSFLELKKTLNGCILALDSSDKKSEIMLDSVLNYSKDSLNIGLLEKNFSFKLFDKQELENLHYNLTLVDKFYDLDSENVLSVYSNKLLNNSNEINLSDLPQIDSEKYYSIYEKCINTFKVKNDSELLCSQIIDNNVVDLVSSKKTWVLEPEIVYYTNIATVFNYMLYYLEPSEFFDNFNNSNINVDNCENNLKLILYKLETFNKETHFSLKETEVLFSLFNKENINFVETSDICHKISEKIQDIFSDEKNSCDDLLLLKFNSLKKLESFNNFESVFSNSLIMLNNTSWNFLKDSNLLSICTNLLEKYVNILSIFSVKEGNVSCFLTDNINSLNHQNSTQEILKDFLTEQNYLIFLKDITIIFNYLPYFLSSNEIYDNFSWLPNYLTNEQKYNFLNFIIFKLKNFNNDFFLTKWEFELLINEMKEIYTNLTDLEKKKLYLELSNILESTFNKSCNDVLFSKLDLSQSENYKEFSSNRQFISEMIGFYSGIKELLVESELKHDIMSKTLSSMYTNENIYLQYNIGSNTNLLLNDIKSIPNNFTQNNELYVISISHILTLFSLFFDFSYNLSETSNFVFDTALIELGVLIVLISLFFKLALSPFHLWSPDVYEGSPSSSTFFFTVISKLSIFVFLLKICYVSFYSIIIDWQFYSLIVAILSILVGSIGGLKQRKFKSILAYSSISNMGLILISFSAGNFEGIKAFFYYFIIYIISGLAVWSIFLLLKLKKKIPSEKHNKDLGDFSLLQELNVILAYASVITLFTIAGIPPMVGFLAKVSVFLSLTEASMYFLALISILSSVIATFFYIRVLKVIFFENVLVGKLFYPTNSKDNIIRSILFFLMLFLFISPALPSFFAYKTTLFLNKNFY
uniref:NADH dehydrogenase subunit 2 n=1 Tax=Pleurosigma intermedium TaxID=197753 RepID=A0A8F9R3Y6_9STRA|nr:NADH dehydrogenase subunit 2 [Pleurosigma sp. mgcode 4]